MMQITTKEKSSKKFYLYSFYYSSASNGIKLTYELIYLLNQMGYDAKNVVPDIEHPEWQIPLKYQNQVMYIGGKKITLNDGIMILIF